MLEITLPECFSICFFNSSRENKVKVPLITKLNPSKVEDISSSCSSNFSPLALNLSIRAVFSLFAK